MAYGKRSWHLVLLPHLMSLTWMNLACIHLSSTSQQLINVFSWLVILILSNYIPFSLTLISYCLVIICKTQNYYNIELYIFCLVFMLLYYLSSLIIKKLKVSHESKIWSLAVCFLILASSFPSTSYRDPSDTPIPWDKYQSICHHNAWYKTNTAEVQISCLPFKGIDISFEGTVTSIDLIQVHNNMDIFVNLLPEPFKSWFVCAIGENYEVCNSSEITPLEKERCRMYESLNLTLCQLRNWDTYLYQIAVEISSRTSPELLLLTNNECTSFVKTLKEGDTLEAIGRLDMNVGGSKPILSLKQARCTSCYTNRECNLSYIPSLPSHSKFSWKNIIWFYFSPLIRYSTD